MGNQTQYDLKAIRLPRLAGLTLRVFVWVVENPLLRWLLIPQLLQSAGINRLRGANLDEPPAFQPHLPVAMDRVDALSSASVSTPAPQTEQGAVSGFATVHDYTQAYRKGTITPEEVADRVLAAIHDSDARNPALRIFIACDSEDVHKQARAASQRWRDGKPLGLMDGVPVAIKDETDQIPYATTFGTRFPGSVPPATDAAVVARLRAAGALLIGKTNMHEIGLGVTGLNTRYGTVRNPYRTDHYPGGSSSGSAAAVAAGICPVAIGSDGGGSIRIPAAFCGVVGLKPTYGRVGRSGTLSLACSVCHPGPLAATARDAAVAYAIVAGADTRDPVSLAQPAVTLAGIEDQDLSGLTLGVYRPWFEHGQPAVVNACNTVLAVLQSRGARTREIVIPELDIGRVAHLVTIASEIATAADPYYPKYRQEFGLDTRISLALVRAFTARDYLQAQRVRTRLSQRFLQVLEAVDVIVTPATACTAPSISDAALAVGESDVSLVTEVMRFAFPANFTGLPAIVFPAGYDPQGLPVGFQAIGRPWQEQVLLRIANAVERSVDRSMPQVHYTILDSVSQVRENRKKPAELRDMTS